MGQNESTPLGTKFKINERQRAQNLARPSSTNLSSNTSQGITNVGIRVVPSTSANLASPSSTNLSSNTSQRTTNLGSRVEPSTSANLASPSTNLSSNTSQRTTNVGSSGVPSNPVAEEVRRGVVSSFSQGQDNKTTGPPITQQNLSNKPLTPPHQIHNEYSKPFATVTETKRDGVKINQSSVSLSVNTNITETIEHAGTFNANKNISPEKRSPASQTKDMCAQIPMFRDVKHVPKIDSILTNNTPPQNPFIASKFNADLMEFEQKSMQKNIEKSNWPKNDSGTKKKQEKSSNSISPFKNNINQTHVQKSLENNFLIPLKEDTGAGSGASFHKDIFTGNEKVDKSQITNYQINKTDSGIENPFGNDQFSPISSTSSPQQINATSDINLKSKARQNKRTFLHQTKRVDGAISHKNHSPNEILKNVEKLAENLTGVVSSNSKSKTTSELNLLFTDMKPYCTEASNEAVSKNNYTLEDCMFHLKNLKIENKETISVLQESLLSKLQKVNSFVLLLQSSPILTDEMAAQMKILKENLSSFSSDHIPEAGDSCSAFNICNKTMYLESVLGSARDSQDPLVTKVYDCKKNPSESSTANIVSKVVAETDLGIVENEIVNNASSSKTIKSLNSFKSLLDELPGELSAEKEYISLQGDLLFCRICEKSVAFHRVNLTEHLKGKNHLKMVQNFNFLQESNQNTFSSLSYVDTPKKNDELPPKYQGILDIVYNSYKTGALLNISLYICRLCDFPTNNEMDATNHLNDENHKKHQLSNAKWHDCDFCSMKIFGTNAHFEEHCLTDQHTGVLRLINESTQNQLSNERRLSTSGSVTEELDRVSVCSSNSDVSNRKNKRLTPHEILLSLAKERNNENTSFTLGLFCQVCNQYVLYKQSTQDHFITEKHKNALFKYKKQKCQKYICRTCNVDLFGDSNLLKEHNSLSGHLEMDQEKSLIEPNKISDTIELSDEEGPHFDLMKAVLKKHVVNAPDDVFYGHYCHLCQCFRFGEEWKSHQKSACHRNRINSSECVGKTMLHECRVCNIQLVCDEQVFLLHKKSLAHNAIQRRQIRANPSNLNIGNERTKSESDKESLDDELGSGEDEDNSDSNSVGSAVRGSNGQQLNQRTVTKKVNTPAEKKRKFLLHPSVMAVFQSLPALQACVAGLQDEINQEGMYRDQKSNIIERDVRRALPGSKLHFFGSQVTGLAMRNSDFDIYIDFDNLSYFKDLPQKEQEMRLRDLVMKFTQPQSSFFVRDAVYDARVPILRVTHKQTNTLCDISCRNGLSVENSQLVRLFVGLDRRVQWLVIAVKWWMRSNGLLDCSIFTSYATTWLVLFFLMRLQEPIVCSVAHLQRACDNYIVGNWNCGFTRDIHKCFKVTNRQTPFELLYRFFEFYKLFPFNNWVLCPHTATVLERKCFDELKLPLAYQLYVNKVASSPHMERLRTGTPICLQDPFDFAHNITKGVSINDLKKFKQLCFISANLLGKRLKE